MRKTKHPRSGSVSSLRLAIDCMPVATREAMLQSVLAHQRILVGAYTDEHGGACPMLAAHRGGGRTEFLSFAKSWDRFAGAREGRVATRREVRTLIAQLQQSLDAVSGVELDKAIAEHRELVIRNRRQRSRLRRQEDRPAEQGPLPSEQGPRLGEQADPSGWIRARRLRLPRRNGAAGRAGRASQGRVLASAGPRR
jgi:hypothetical protein